MTKKLRILAITVAVSIFIIIICLITINNVKPTKTQDLVLKTSGNNIALYKGEQIIEVYDEIDVRRLTDYDRQLLKKGILVESESDLLSILEDYD